jgi:hypothetical protein
LVFFDFEGGQNESHVWLGGCCCGRGCVECWWRCRSPQLLQARKGPLLQAGQGSLLQRSEDLLCPGSDVLCHRRSVRQRLQRDGDTGCGWCDRSSSSAKGKGNRSEAGHVILSRAAHAARH